MNTRNPLAESEVVALLDSLSNWGRWGESDLLGTLNLLPADSALQAASLVQDGAVVSCALPIRYDRVTDDDAAPEGTRAYIQPMHLMLNSGEGLDPGSPVRHGGADLFVIAPHGLAVTHIDAPSHTFFRGTMFNGIPATAVSTAGGASKGGVELVAGGIVGRCVILDIARAQGRESLDDGEAIYPEDLDACAELQGVTVSPGDLLFVRTGYRSRKPRGPATVAGGYPGLQAACLPWLQERQISLLATDAAADVRPSGYNVGDPIHLVGMWAMGLWIVDNCDFEQLSRECAARSRWTAQATLAPLALTGGTGSPVNPLVTF